MGIYRTPTVCIHHGIDTLGVLMVNTADRDLRPAGDNTVDNRSYSSFQPTFPSQPAWGRVAAAAFHLPDEETKAALGGDAPCPS